MGVHTQIYLVLWPGDHASMGRSHVDPRPSWIDGGLGDVHIGMNCEIHTGQMDSLVYTHCQHICLNIYTNF